MFKLLTNLPVNDSFKWRMLFYKGKTGNSKHTDSLLYFLAALNTQIE